LEAPAVGGPETLATEEPVAADTLDEAPGTLELWAAMRMVNAGIATRVTLAGFAWRPDQVAEMIEIGRSWEVEIIPVIATGGGGVDLKIERRDDA